MSDLKKAETDALFNKIYDESYIFILKYVSARTRTADDAADIVQETYLELYKVICKKDDYINDPNAFVMNIAKKKLFRHYSLVEKLKSIIPLHKSDENDADPINEIGGFEFEDSLIDSVLLDEIWNYIMRFEKTTRQIFIMKYCHDKSLEDIAESLNLPLHTVRNKLYRSIERLKTLFNVH
ncbi:MAG: sigma-70 family RNA polymerase sigma factor [Eubacteriales bacterium]|nr:sigma-70 family RNA polymerase sigma factor [Eubacteriales bacterium]